MQPRQQLSPIITSHDLLKTLAVLTMIVDHIGMCFFPEHMGLRAIGRTSAPLWLFLIGHARSRDIPPSLWVGALILFAVSLCVGPVFPANILFVMIAVRLVLDRTAEIIFASKEKMVISGVIFFLLLAPTAFISDYGIWALAMAIFGLIISRGEMFDVRTKHYFGGFVFLTYLFFSWLLFDFTALQFAGMSVLCALVFILLYHFKPGQYAALTEKLPVPMGGLIRLCGRRSLEIFVIHLTLFKILAAVIGVEGYTLFELRWI